MDHDRNRRDDPLEDFLGRLVDDLGGSSFGGLFGLSDDRGDDGGPDASAESSASSRTAGSRTAGSRARTPTLDRYGRDLTAAARAGHIDPVVGREREIAAVLEVLGRRTKNNAVLVGDPGVGKTAIAEGIAARIAAGAVPASLTGRRVVALDLAGMLAGTKYRGEFEQRLRRVIDEVVGAERSVVLFLDEFHAVVGAGSGVEGRAMDAADILKPALARGDLQVLGATTRDEYRRHVESDAALERRFAPIVVAEPGVEDTVAILDGLAPSYEHHHGVRLPADARRAAVELTARHVRDRFLPDKAIDAMDVAAARVRLRALDGADDEQLRADAARRMERLTREQAAAVGAEDYERAAELRREIDDARRARAAGSTASGRPVVAAADVAQVVADTTGIPVAALTDDDRARLLDLSERLRRRVVGQDDAVETVVDAVLAGRAGMSDPERPVASLLLTGPTGVGKTELARALAEALFGSEERIVRVDLGEFRDAHSTSRLVGAPPGYVGHDRPGELTEAVRRTPYCVVLLDEIEKAHPDVLALLLAVLDDGRLTDARGRTVSFADAVVVMTSNVAVDALTVALRPEFLGRVDDTVVFTALDDAALRRIVELQLARTRSRLADQDIELVVTDAALYVLLAHGRDPRYGARPLRAAVAKAVDRPIARRVVAGAARAGSVVTVDAGADSTCVISVAIATEITHKGGAH